MSLRIQTYHDKICTIWNHEEEEGLSFKVNFPSSQCSDRECNQIVLWDCCVCWTPCSECFTHVTYCEYCEKRTCKECLVTESLCKECSYRCAGCENLFIELNEPRVVCQGLKCDGSCQFSTKPYCSNCAFSEDEDGPNIRACDKCNRMACVDCEDISGCEICFGRFCSECNHVDLCKVCNKFSCDECNPVYGCVQVKENLLTSKLLDFSFLYPPSFLILSFLIYLWTV
jgi:hypothetical protein